MSEKVLGVKCGVGREDFLRSAFMGAVVPVVSIEWLEKEAQKLYDKKLKDSPMTWTRQAYRNALKDLLAEAKKKVKE